VLFTGWEKFVDYVHLQMVDHLIPGVAVAVWADGETLFARGFGHRNRGAHDPVDTSTVFGIASITKSFSAMAIMQLVEKRLITLEDPAVKYLPELRINGMAPKKIQIRHLLSHTSGLAPLPGLSYAMAHSMQGYPTWNGERRTVKPDAKLPTFDDYNSYLNYLQDEHCDIYGEPGQYFSYSNDSFVLIGAIIERVSGQDYRSYVRENILIPVGMDRTTFSKIELIDIPNVTRLYFNNCRGETLEAPGWQDLKVYDAGGGLKSCVDDMIRYAAAYIGTNHKVLKPESVRTMYTPLYQLSRTAHYGLALQVSPDYHGLTLVEHGGSLTGVSSTFGFVPEKRLAAVVLTNVSGVPAADIWLAAINTAIGLPILVKRSSDTTWNPPDKFLDRFIGRYQSREGADILVYSEGDHLTIGTMGESFILRFTGPDSAVYNYRGQERVVRFFLKQNGLAWGIFSGNSMTGIRLIKKVDG